MTRRISTGISTGVLLMSMLGMLTGCYGIQVPAAGTGAGQPAEETQTAGEAGTAAAAAAAEEAGETAAENETEGLTEEQADILKDPVIPFRGAEESARAAVEAYDSAVAQQDAMVSAMADTIADTMAPATTASAMKAWLMIPDTAVSMALAQPDTAEEKDFYSSHALDGSEAEYGWAYIDYGNESDFTDPNTVLHGSAAGEDAPFYPMLAYGDVEYFTAHPYIYICTPTTVLEYTAFATYEDVPEDLLIRYNCYDYAEYAQMIEDLYERRDMMKIADEELRETADAAWSVITIEAADADGRCRYVTAVLTGSALRK